MSRMMMSEPLTCFMKVLGFSFESIILTVVSDGGGVSMPPVGFGFKVPKNRWGCLFYWLIVM